jgi:hypothetical protein
LLDAYARALATNLLQTSPDQLVPLVLARASYERRRVEAGGDVEEAFMTLVQTVEEGIALARKGVGILPLAMGFQA